MSSRPEGRRVAHPACSRLRKLISPYDHGAKYEGRVVHANPNAQVVRGLNERGWIPGRPHQDSESS